MTKKKTEPFQPQNFAVALGMCRIAVNDMTAEIIFETYKKVLELGGEFSLRDSSKIVCDVEEKYKHKEELRKVMDKDFKTCHACPIRTACKKAEKCLAKR